MHTSSVEEPAQPAFIPNSLDKAQKNPGPCKPRKTRPRWRYLNELSDSNPNKRAKTNSIGFSYANWHQYCFIYNPRMYSKALERLTSLQEQDVRRLHMDLYRIHDFFVDGRLTEAEMRHLVFPILECARIFAGDHVKIMCERKVEGNQIKAHGKFEFLLSTYNTVSVVVEVKTTDMAQGMAQACLGAEVVSEIGNLSCVHAVVTNHNRWIFIRSSMYYTDFDECRLKFSRGKPTLESLRIIVQKMYAVILEASAQTRNMNFSAPNQVP